MDQIRQHEWEKVHTDLNSRWHICAHCKTARFRDTYEDIFYTNYADGDRLPEEPACITRYPEQKETSIYQELFNHISGEHGLILLDSEMQEIIHIVNKIGKEAGKV